MKPPSAWAMERAMAALQAAYAEDDDADLIRTTEDAVALTHQTIRAVAEAQHMAKAAKERADEIRERAERFKKRADRFRQAALQAMAILDLRKIELPDVTASIRPGQASVLITDEAALPEEYVRTKREPNKSAIADDLRCGVVIPGAVLSNGSETLQLRTK